MPAVVAAMLTAILVCIAGNAADISFTNFSAPIDESLAAIVSNLKPDDGFARRTWTSALEGLWSPILEEWAIASRDQKVMKMKPTYNILTRPDRPLTTPEQGSGNRDVTETDLYLLGAIEKLVYRVDFMEKRLRRTEELLYYVMAGNNNHHDMDPCPSNFTRAGHNCYHFSNREFNWKSSASMCKSLGSTLAEMETIEENQDVVTTLQANPQLRGKDYWTGGLNPGLLWIWSNSARPVSSNSTSSSGNDSIRGNGRCLKLGFNPALKSYAYQGSDCSSRINYICEMEENRASRALQLIEETLQGQRVAKSLPN